MNETLSTFRYNWYETNLSKFLEKYALPVKYEGDFIQFLKKYRDDFLKDFDELLQKGPIKGYGDNGEMIYSQIEQQFECIESCFSIIVDIIESWEKNELGKVEKLIDKLMSNAREDFLVTNINQNGWNKTFYRVRISKEQGEFENKPLELFHIPYSKRFLARNDRYNMAGRVCLYLSSVLNLAWKECGMPTNFYYSSFNPSVDVIQGWDFLCFLSPQKIAQDWLTARVVNDPNGTAQDVARYLRTYPLIFACSIVNKMKDVAYKPEYIMPQLLMQWIEHNFDEIKGVLYFPCTDYRSYRVWNGYNVVMPAKCMNNDDYSEILLKAFEISNPSFEDNHLTEANMDKIDNFYKKIVGFSYNQAEMSDCILAIHKHMVHISEGLKNTQYVPSAMLLSYIEMLLSELDHFKKEYRFNKIVEACRSSVVYQERYEKDYVYFENLFNEFLEIIDLMDKYHHNIERGILIEKV